MVEEPGSITEPTAGTVVSELAEKRSHEDAKVAHDHAKAVTQGLLLINGGAATAVLTFIGKSGVSCPSWSLDIVPLSVLSYCIGLALGIFGGLFMQRAASHWSVYWRDIALGLPDPERAGTLAMRYQTLFSMCIFGSLACFMLASGLLAVVLRNF